MASANTLRERSQTNSSPAPRSEVEERRATAWIGQGVVVEGRITSSQDLRIDGRVEGTIEVGVSSVRFGFGVTREVGMYIADLGARRVMVITDPVVGRLKPAQTVMESLEANRVPAVLYDRVRVEPTDESFLDAIAFAKDGGYDAFVAVGGGSTIDTAKAVNLYTTYPPGDFLDYVNTPIGKGMAVPGPLRPLMAIPTTAGTGREEKGVRLFRLAKMLPENRIRERRPK